MNPKPNMSEYISRRFWEFPFCVSHSKQYGKYIGVHIGVPFLYMKTTLSGMSVQNFWGLCSQAARHPIASVSKWCWALYSMRRVRLPLPGSSEKVLGRLNSIHMS